MIVYQSVLFGLFLVATVMLFRTLRSVLDIWLLVALSGWLIETLLIMTLDSRFSAGWYGLFVMTVFSHLVVMLALIAESNRLYARLALSAAARRRERETRLMSMEAVTAAISHEVGQPLTAVTLNASAALNWLTQSNPDVSKAITSLGAVGEANKRTFEVIKSIRAMFAKGAGQASKLDLNDLVRESAALLSREMSAAKVSLELALEDPLPPVRVDRVQIQRVLVNLLTNAIESIDSKGAGSRPGTQRRPRVIAVRSAKLKENGEDVLLEVSDTGQGISAGELDRIFEPFFTTKATGTGLGLSLCQSIIEDHGGRLWATIGQERGATFHLTLPTAA